ncbi:MAG: T9SS type A sorting domain-containing protein [Bacteroidetes bacterium]|nr:T9SS type A sorting domain-containing protein [Bacteroidota bacterium]
MTMKRFLTLLVSLTAATSIVFAGGPLYTLNNKAYRYQSNVISYKLDRGPLGVFSSTQARTLANECFKVWQDVATSNVSFAHTDADTLPVDVNGTNFLSYTTLTDFKYDGINPIIFDSDGAITDELFGVGASESVIGFAGSGDSDNDGDYDEGEAVMNGLFADGTASSFTYDEWKATFVHEFGHFLGLDHTQIGSEFINNSSQTIYVPTMYPFATVNDVPLGALNPDDIAAISTLYPEAGYAATVGSISGAVTRANGSVVRGANVVAISTGADSLMNRISTVTDYFEQNNGNYTISGLAPGSYVVRVEPIETDFIEGSSVGPYSYEATGLSFVNPIAAEYYNGANEASDPAVDDPEARSAVTVTAGNTTGSINVIGNARPAGAALITEDFEFTGALADNGWSVHSGTTAPLTTTAGLTYTGYSKNAGNAVAVGNAGGIDVNKGFEEQNADGTTIYSSLLIRVTDAASDKTGDHLFHLGTRTAPASFTSFSSRLFVRIVGGAVNFGVSNTSTVVYGTTNYSKNVTYLAVIKYTISTAGNDDVRLWIIPSGVPATEAAAGAATAVNSATAGQNLINAVGIRQGSATTSVAATIDGIIIGTNWPAGPVSVRRVDAPVIPASAELTQNYPNPFNPSTLFRFSLPSAQRAVVRIFDMLGREVAVAAEGMFEAGTHEVSFDGSRLSSGSYLYTLETGSNRIVRRMTLVK